MTTMFNCCLKAGLVVTAAVIKAMTANEIQPQCETASLSIKEALAAAHSESPDLILSDVAMPAVFGIELAIQMRAQYPNCKILLFSEQAATLDLLEGARAQGYDFRLPQKPVFPSVFLSEIGQLSA
jgi:CheY-like chemotaxis protein